MTLEQWLESTETAPAELAVRLDVTASTVRKWATGIRMPRPKVMRRLAVATDGRVQPGDFYRAVAR